MCATLGPSLMDAFSAQEECATLHPEARLATIQEYAGLADVLPQFTFQPDGVWLGYTFDGQRACTAAVPETRCHPPHHVSASPFCVSQSGQTRQALPWTGRTSQAATGP